MFIFFKKKEKKEKLNKKISKKKMKNTKKFPKDLIRNIKIYTVGKTSGSMWIGKGLLKWETKF